MPVVTPPSSPVASSALVTPPSSPVASLARDRQLRELLHVSREGHIQTVRALLETGLVDASAGSGWGGTALHAASRHGRAGVIQLLLDGGWQVNATNKCGSTALHLAVLSEQRLRCEGVAR